MSIRLKTIGIVAADMGKTLSFYRTLGMDIPEGKDEETNLEVETPEGITLGFLSLEMAMQADPNYTKAIGQSMNLQFMVDSPSQVDELHDRLVAAGYASYAAPWDAFWGQRFARISDPDGRVVNVYADLPEG